MGYLYFNNENIINEGIKSVSYNILKGGLKLGTIVPYVDKASFVYNNAKDHNIIPNQNKMNIFHKFDIKFFDSLYSISKQLNDKIFEWCSKTGASLLSNKILNNKNKIVDYENNFRKNH